MPDMETNLPRGGEQTGWLLGRLYERSGYTRFKMGKFEEYELYARNKDFLAGDRMITFTDADGRLLALKPDVTLSIIKNTQEGDFGVRKVYYNENVYRSGRGERAFREIRQVGLECVGNLDAYQTYEVLRLAIASLQAVSGDYMLDVSHMGLLSGLMRTAGVPEEEQGRVLSSLRAKNGAELQALCREWNLDKRGCALLRLLIDLYGDLGGTLDVLEPYCAEPESAAALAELRAVRALLDASGEEVRMQLDFSVASDMGYYNGIVFRGFLRGLPCGVLSGGRYDKLVRKMGKSFGAIGFAITLNELERLTAQAADYDADVLLLYDENSDLPEVARRSRALSEEGKRVLTQPRQNAALRVRETVDMRGGAANGGT